MVTVNIQNKAYSARPESKVVTEDVSSPSTVIASFGRKPVYTVLKRIFDICFSLSVILGLSPLYLLIALLIKLEDPKAPVFFLQERVTKNGRTFKMIKFRSMVPDAEAMLERLAHLNRKDGPAFKIENDPRVTKIGSFLRKTSLDELPQFFNTLVGDISIVGPRPALPSEVEQYTPHQLQRLLVPGGITCLWQTRRNRDSITFDEWIELDLKYIEKRSLWADTKIIIQTVGVVLSAQGS